MLLQSQSGLTYADTAKNIAKMIHSKSKSKNPVIIGPIASFISLIDPSLQPVESYYTKYLTIEDRIEKWHPEFLIVFEKEKDLFFSTISEKLKFVSNYQALNHTFDNIELYEIIDSNRMSK